MKKRQKNVAKSAYRWVKNLGINSITLIVLRDICITFGMFKKKKKKKKENSLKLKILRIKEYIERMKKHIKPSGE